MRSERSKREIKKKGRETEEGKLGHWVREGRKRGEYKGGKENGETE